MPFRPTPKTGSRLRIVQGRLGDYGDGIPSLVCDPSSAFRSMLAARLMCWSDSTVAAVSAGMAGFTADPISARISAANRRSPGVWPCTSNSIRAETATEAAARPLRPDPA